MSRVLQDVFYLTMEELFAFVDGRAVTNNLSELAQVRKREFDSYRKVQSQYFASGNTLNL